MKKISLLSCGLLLAALASSSAYADTISFNFAGTSGNTPSSNQFTGSGQFTITQQSAGVYLITGVSGNITEGSNVGNGTIDAIASLIQPGVFNTSSHSDTNDNLLFVPVNNNGNNFDKFGVAFTLADGSQVILYNNDGFGTFITSKGGTSAKSEQIASYTLGAITPTQTASPVPEPGSIALLGTGVLGLAGAIRRKLSV
jgi:hypothetical protein